MNIDIDTLVYAIIAILILARLWFVLGTRNDNETQRPNPFVQVPPKATGLDAAALAAAQAASSRMQPALPPPTSLAGGLALVAGLDNAFNEKQFLQNVRDVFPIVVSAYAAGNMNSIVDFLSPDLLTHFRAAADARSAEGQTAQSRVALIKEAEVVSAHAAGTKVFVTTQIVSHQENVLRDKTGTIIGGAENQLEEITDVWTFSKDTQDPSAKWVVDTTG